MLTRFEFFRRVIPLQYLPKTWPERAPTRSSLVVSGGAGLLRSIRLLPMWPTKSKPLADDAIPRVIVSPGVINRAAKSDVSGVRHTYSSRYQRPWARS